MKKLTLMIMSLLFSLQAYAWSILPYSDTTFINLQQSNRPVLIHIHAHWCSTCAQQNMKLNRIIDTPEYNDLTVLKVNFDTQKEVVKRFGATKQSVFIMYKGSAERMRSMADTQQDSIKALIDAGMN